MKRIAALTLLCAGWMVLAACEPDDSSPPLEPRLGEAEPLDDGGLDRDPAPLPGQADPAESERPQNAVQTEIPERPRPQQDRAPDDDLQPPERGSLDLDD